MDSFHRSFIPFPRTLGRDALIGSLVAIGLIAGCRSGDEEKGATDVPVATPVTLAVPLERDVQNYEEFTGHVAAQYSVEVRARVTGYLDQIKFQDGLEVKEGDLLFVIDPRPFKAANDSAVAMVAVKKASVVFREAEFNRNKELITKNAVSRSEYDQSAAAYEEAKALVLSAEAESEISKLNLGFTEIRAAIGGRISSRNIDIGNLVIADQTLLTSIVSVDPMYVNFDVDERRLLRFQGLIREGKIRSAEDSKVPIELALDNETGFPHPGVIDFTDNQIDPKTGTIRMRAVVPNPSPTQGRRTLTAGMFARIRVPLGDPQKSVLVAEQAIGSDQGQKFVYVVDTKQEAQYRRVRTGRVDEGLRVIEEGLKPGEQVIVAGIQRVRPGAKVEPKTVDMATFAVTPPGKPTTEAPAALNPSPEKN